MFPPVRSAPSQDPLVLLALSMTEADSYIQFVGTAGLSVVAQCSSDHGKVFESGPSAVGHSVKIFMVYRKGSLLQEMKS